MLVDSPATAVLLIQDRATDNTWLESHLSLEIRATLHISSQPSLGSGIAALLKDRYDVILLNLSVASEEVSTAIERLWQLPLQTPIVVLSEYKDDQLARAVLQKGVQDYLSKDIVNSEILVRSIRYAIERKQAQETIRQTQRMEAIGQLTGGIAHDFNNLLTVINGYSELALDSIAADSELHKALCEINQAGTKASALTQQLLSFSRKKAWSPRWLSVNTVLEGMRSLLKRLIDESIDIDFTMGKNLGWVQADQSQIEQIILNLAINGKDAMPRGGRLTICTHRATSPPGDLQLPPSKPYLCIDISDTGKGIAPDVLPHIFDPFFTTKKEGEGTGLGLANVQYITQQVEGHIEVDSGPGGTTFQVYIPCCEKPPTANSTTTQQNKIPAGKGTILVVDDEESVLNVTCAALESCQYRVLAASTPEQALTHLERHGSNIDILLTDVILPGIDGVALAQKMQEHYPHLTVLFMSGYPLDTLAKYDLDPAQVELIHKPFTLRNLVNHIQSAID